MNLTWSSLAAPTQPSAFGSTGYADSSARNSGGQVQRFVKPPLSATTTIWSPSLYVSVQSLLGALNAELRFANVPEQVSEMQASQFMLAIHI